MVPPRVRNRHGGLRTPNRHFVGTCPSPGIAGAHETAYPQQRPSVRVRLRTCKFIRVHLRPPGDGVDVRDGAGDRRRGALDRIRRRPIRLIRTGGAVRRDRVGVCILALAFSPTRLQAHAALHVVQIACRIHVEDEQKVIIPHAGGTDRTARCGYAGGQVVGERGHDGNAVRRRVGRHLHPHAK